MLSARVVALLLIYAMLPEINVMMMITTMMTMKLNHDPFTHTLRATSRHIHNGEFFAESVPFSCCSVEVLRPCISNFVHDRTRHFEYHPEKEMTIYQHSCADVTSRFMRNVVRRVGRFSICVFLVSVSSTATSSIVVCTKILCVKCCRTPLCHGTSHDL